MKRLMSLLLTLCLLIPCLTAPALADTPKPIPTIDYDSIPEPREGLHHYLLLCSDQWTNKLVNTDGIVIVTLDTVTHRIMLTSIIRDALVERPDGVIGRINYIARNSGPEALCKVISQHLGIKIEKYILLNFQMIANIIDYLGGVDITVNASEAAYLRRYPLDPGQTEPTMAQAGTYCFTGRAAVIYMRIRKAGGGGDFMRTQRARTVMSTLADQCRTFTYDQARDLVDVIMKNNLQTNMTLDDMIAAMEQALKLRTCVIEELRIPQYVKDETLTPLHQTYKETADLEAELPTLDVLYMTRIQQERFFNEEDYLRLKGCYSLNAKLLEQAPADMPVLHPLPRIDEIKLDVDNDPRAAYFDQVHNGVYIRMAIILALLGIPDPLTGKSVLNA